LGILSDDFKQLPSQTLMRLSDTDTKKAKQLLASEFVKRHPSWKYVLAHPSPCRREIESMLGDSKKAEIEALSTVGIGFLEDVYLPMKIQQKLWIT
jgi:DNA topoisomerase VI subunit A